MNMVLFSSVGFERNLSLLEIVFPRGLNQMEASKLIIVNAQNNRSERRPDTSRIIAPSSAGSDWRREPPELLGTVSVGDRRIQRVS